LGDRATAILKPDARGAVGHCALRYSGRETYLPIKKKVRRLMMSIDLSVAPK
jgi:hypothetical protein